MGFQNGAVRSGVELLKARTRRQGGPTDFFFEIGCAPLIGILLTSQIAVIRGNW